MEVWCLFSGGVTSVFGDTRRTEPRRTEPRRAELRHTPHRIVVREHPQTVHVKSALGGECSDATVPVVVYSEAECGVFVDVEQAEGSLETGRNVTRFTAGDRVYCRMPLKKIGAFAQYAAVEESALAVIPEYLSYEQAATVPLAALACRAHPRQA